MECCFKQYFGGSVEQKVYHSEHKREMTLWFLLGMYAWHSRHHTAHILPGFAIG